MEVAAALVRCNPATCVFAVVADEFGLGSHRVCAASPDGSLRGTRRAGLAGADVLRDPASRPRFGAGSTSTAAWVSGIPAPAHHRSRDRRSADLQRGRLGGRRPERRDLQLPRAARASSSARGHRFATRSDTEVIVHLYEEHGAACVERLRGMFAFALWDARAARLLLARDRVGKKPLFYAERGGTLWFGSEAKAILEDPESPREVDLEAIDSFLHFQYVPAPAERVRGARKLPPAHTLTWEDGRSRSGATGSSPTRRRTLRRTEEEVHERDPRGAARGDAAAAGSDVPLGAFLSGGVDSSAVVAVMAQLSAGRSRRSRSASTTRRSTRPRYAREVARALRHRPPRVPGRAARDGRPAAARLALRRAVRRPAPRSRASTSPS